MKPIFEILSRCKKQRYSNTAVRFPLVIHDIPSVLGVFRPFALAGCARSGAHSRLLMRKNTPNRHRYFSKIVHR